MFFIKVLLCKLKELHISDAELLEQAGRYEKIDTIRCPNCKKKGLFRRITPYERVMISMVKGKRQVQNVKVPRIKCTHCGKTESLLADILIPFSSYSLTFILQTLQDYLKRSGSVVAFCAEREISISTLYTWRKLFQQHYNLWFHSVQKICCVTQKSIVNIQNISCFPSAFQTKFHCVFMQFSAKPSFNKSKSKISITYL